MVLLALAATLLVISIPAVSYALSTYRIGPERFELMVSTGGVQQAWQVGDDLVGWGTREQGGRFGFVIPDVTQTHLARLESAGVPYGMPRAASTYWVGLVWLVVPAATIAVLAGLRGLRRKPVPVAVQPGLRLR
ncbi:hypothetical protein ABI59_00965 [Acidobacteria bacterium Mor1]|nr:hypothetical protein ABI59_00965 [Acidobacteria bacterium Mor1]